MRKTQLARKKYAVDRQWCMKLQLYRAEDLGMVNLEGNMNPWLRVVCDPRDGNPTVNDTTVAWAGRCDPNFNEFFYIDVKLVTGLYIEAWTRDIHDDEFIGRGWVEIKGAAAKGAGMRALQSGPITVPLYNINVGEVPEKKTSLQERGRVYAEVQLLDPLKDEECVQDTGWMMPRHRMQFVMSRLGHGMSTLKLGKVLNMVPKTGALEAQKPAEDQPLDNVV